MKRKNLFILLGLFLLAAALGAGIARGQAGGLTVVSTSPETGLEGVDCWVPLSVVFDRDIQLSGQAVATVTGENSGPIEVTPKVDHYVLWLELKPPGDYPGEHFYLPPNDTVHVTIHREGVSAAGNAEDKLEQDLTYSFKTSDREPGGGDYTFSFVTPTERVAPPAHPGVKLEKVADRSYARVGDTVTYTCRVTNTGDIAVKSAEVKDLLAPGGKIEFNLGEGGLAPGQTAEVTYQHQVSANDQDPLVNKAEVTAVTAAGDVTGEGSSTVDIVHPGVKLEKVADRSYARVGDTVTYTCVVTNIGDTDLRAAYIVDRLAPGGRLQIELGNDGILRPGEDAVGRYTYRPVIAGLLTNLATVTAISDAGQVSAGDSYTVDVKGEITPIVAGMKPPLPVTGSNLNLLVMAGALLIVCGLYLLWRKKIS